MSQWIGLALALAAPFGFWFGYMAGYADGERDTRKRRPANPHDTCRCGHSRVWHEHHHDRTYCANSQCGCRRFEIGNRNA